MPIDLADYGAGIKAALKKSGFACVYVASVGDGRPCRVGYAFDLAEAIRRLQRASPVPVIVNDALWCPDRSIATMIAQSVLASIAPHRKAGGWHDLGGESVASAVHLETFRLYPNAVTVPHKQLIYEWTKRGTGSLVPAPGLDRGQRP